MPWPWPADAIHPTPCAAVRCAAHIFSDGSIAASKDSMMPTRWPCGPSMSPYHRVRYSGYLSVVPPLSSPLSGCVSFSCSHTTASTRGTWACFKHFIYKKVHFFSSVHFQPIFFFLIQVKGGGATPPPSRSGPGETAGLSPGPKEENSDIETEAKEALSHSGEGGSFSWILFPFVKKKKKSHPLTRSPVLKAGVRKQQQ